MASAPCPKCGTPITGSLAEITRHVKSCGRTSKQRTSKPGAPQGAVSEAPVLPWEIRVPLMISSLNQSQYSHWSVYKRGKDSWSTALSLLLRPVAGLRLNWSEWQITRAWAPPRRELDYLNLVGGCKPLADIMIERGVIVDDCPTNFHCDYFQRRGSVSCTVITLLRFANERPADAIH
jgi:hypothetical protein